MRPRLQLKLQKVAALNSVFAICFMMPLFASAQRIQTADQVIEKYFEAMGGEMLLNSLSSFKLTATYNDGPMYIHFHNGTLHWNSKDGKYAYWLDRQERFWQRNEGIYKLRGDLSPGYPSRFMNLPPQAIEWIDDDSLNITNVGSRQLNGIDTWCLKFEKEGQLAAERFFDQKNGLLLQTDSGDGLSCSYKYSRLNDVLFPTTVTSADLGQHGRTLEITEMEVDPTHEGIDFAIPDDLAEEHARRTRESGK